MTETGGLETGGGRAEEQGLLFEYSIRFLLIAGLLELILYRLVSRLGMHLSKVAQQYEAVRIAFKALSATGFFLLNLVSLLLFLALLLVLLNKTRGIASGRFDRLLVPGVSLLVLLTLAYLVFPPAMLGSVAYNLITGVLLVLLGTEYVLAHRAWSQRVMVTTFLFGVTGWLYYQTISTTYGLLGWAAAPPLAHEVNRLGEALMVLSSILVLWAYGGLSIGTRNKRQQRRMTLFGSVAGALFLGLLFLDYLLGLYDEGVAESVRKAGQGIGWIFQMGMGYTFYLPFACYVAGLLCWSYTVIKLTVMGRPAGFGLGLMFIAGYALQLSHLTLMVILGLMLLTLDKRRLVVVAREVAPERPLAAATPAFGAQG
jgi:hypothetical protein